MGSQRASDIGYDADVVIVGCGPVGATLANLLGQSGISTLVLEREEAAYQLPRAVHFDDECMRVFETIGLAEAIEPTVHVSVGMRFVDAAGQPLLSWPRPQARTPTGWHASYRFHQPDLENILRAGLGRYTCVATRTRIEALAADEDRGGVTIRAENLTTGKLERIRARYVVGCDGARSIIRRKIGETPDDLRFDERWMVVDVLLRHPKPELGDWSVQYCDPARPATYVRGTGNRRRWRSRYIMTKTAPKWCALSGSGRCCRAGCRHARRSLRGPLAIASSQSSPGLGALAGLC